MEADTNIVQEANDYGVILAIGGGKGGVGKTVLSASMAMGLAMLQKEVIVVDGDFGGPNLHKVFGNQSSGHSTQDFFNRKVSSLNDLLMPHPQFENLKIIRNNNAGLGSANIPYALKLKFIRHLQDLKADYIIIDLGAGTHYDVLDLFLLAHLGIVLVTPDPLSILDGYQFIKRVFLRKLIQIFNKNEPAFEIVRAFVSDHSEKHHANIESLIEQLTPIDPNAVTRIQEMQQHFSPKLVINRLLESQDEKNCLSIQIAAETLLSIDVDYWGSIQQDPAVLKSLAAGTPFISFDSKAMASRDLATMVITKLLKPRGIRRMQAMHTIHKMHSVKSESQVICSIHCPYWNDCELKKGGYPCELGGL